MQPNDLAATILATFAAECKIFGLVLDDTKLEIFGFFQLQSRFFVYGSALMKAIFVFASSIKRSASFGSVTMGAGKLNFRGALRFAKTLDRHNTKFIARIWRVPRCFGMYV